MTPPCASDRNPTPSTNMPRTSHALSGTVFWEPLFRMLAPYRNQTRETWGNDAPLRIRSESDAQHQYAKNKPRSVWYCLLGTVVQNASSLSKSNSGNLGK